MKHHYSNQLAVKFAVFMTTGFLLFSQSVYAADVNSEQSAEIQSSVSGTEVTVRLSTGFLTGEAKENLYFPSNVAHIGGNKISELTWKIDNLYMLGVGVSIKPLSWMTINGDYWFKMADGEGTMDDYDWLSPSLEWTDWSHHEDTDVTKGSIFDINADMTFYSTESVSISGIAGYKQENFEWKAYGGDYIYTSAPGNFRDLQGSFPDGQLGITYEQTFKVPYLGLGLNTTSGKFLFNARVIFSAFVTGEEMDNHHLRNLVTNGEYSGGSMIGFDVAGGYALTDKFMLKAAYKYSSYDEENYDLSWTEAGITETLADAGGMDNYTSMLSLALEYKF